MIKARVLWPARPLSLNLGSANCNGYPRMGNIPRKMTEIKKFALFLKISNLVK
jgi:hypothetical protein